MVVFHRGKETKQIIIKQTDKQVTSSTKRTF